MQPLSRRSFLKATASAAGTAIAPKAIAATHGKRNVLFLIVDDLNHSLGCYGEPVHTPNLDALAASGTRFHTHQCQYPLCGPSRTSLLTGLAPDYTGVLVNATMFRKTTPDAVTLPQLFRQNGYYVARVGKIFHANNPMDEGQDGADDPQSWEYKYDNAGLDRTEQQDRVVNYSPIPVDNPGGVIGGYPSPSSDRQVTDGVGADEIIRLLKEKKDTPFFLAYGLYRPHVPWIVPEDYFKQYPLETIHAEPFDPAELKQAPRTAYNSRAVNRDMDEEHCKRAKAGYYASITYIDKQIGRVLAELKQQGLDRNTLVVFVADHGWQMGQHGMWEKMTIFEWCTRVPFIVAGPGVPKGATITQATEHLDIYPTLVEMCGLEKMPAVHGQSLAPFLKHGVKPSWDKGAVTQIRRASKTASTDGYTIRTERYRYTQWSGTVEGEEFYDYQTDPREVKNLAKEPSVATLKADLRRRLEDTIAIRKGTPARAATT